MGIRFKLAQTSSYQAFSFPSPPLRPVRENANPTPQSLKFSLKILNLIKIPRRTHIPFLFPLSPAAPSVCVPAPPAAAPERPSLSAQLEVAHTFGWNLEEVRGLTMREWSAAVSKHNEYAKAGRGDQ